MLNSTSVDILIDTGAEVNVLPSSIGVPVKIDPCTATVQAWGKFNIPVRGKATCTVTYKGKTVAADFLVVDLPRGKGTSLPLFSLELCQRLDMIS